MEEPTEPVNRWSEAEHALGYLAIADTIPHRTEGEAELLACLPPVVDRVLDLGCGDGRLIALVRSLHPHSIGVAIDFSPEMVRRVAERFDGVGDVRVIHHDLDDQLPGEVRRLAGGFDAVVSSFAIHHLVDERKRSLFAEVASLLRPGGVFANLEHVASASPTLHQVFLQRIGVRPDDDDPSNKLAPVETQLAWLRQSGFIEVDCHWKWRELALLVGLKG